VCRRFTAKSVKCFALCGLSVYYCIIFVNVLLLYLLSHLCKLFTLIYLNQAAFLKYTVLRLFCMYKFCCMLKYVLLFYISTSRSLCAVPLFWLYFFLISSHTISGPFSVFHLQVFVFVMWCVPFSHHIIVWNIFVALYLVLYCLILCCYDFTINLSVQFFPRQTEECVF